MFCCAPQLDPSAAVSGALAVDQVSKAAGGAKSLFQNPIWAAIFGGEGTGPGSKVDSLGLEPAVSEVQHLLDSQGGLAESETPGEDEDRETPSRSPRDALMFQVMRHLVAR